MMDIIDWFKSKMKEFVKENAYLNKIEICIVKDDGRVSTVDLEWLFNDYDTEKYKILSTKQKPIICNNNQKLYTIYVNLKEI